MAFGTWSAVSKDFDKDSQRAIMCSIIHNFSIHSLCKAGYSCFSMHLQAFTTEHLSATHNVPVSVASERTANRPVKMSRERKRTWKK